MRVSLVHATVDDAAGTVQITRSKERGLLCMLALTPGRMVSVDRLIDGMWGDAPPRTAAKTLQTYVKNLRSRIAEAGAPRDTLATEPPGYVLAVEPGDVDVLQSEQLAEQARRSVSAGNLVLAKTEFLAALELVDAEKPAAFDGPGLDAALVRVTEGRRRLIDDLTDVQLQLGEHLELVAPLSERLEAEPQNERGWAQLMTALYRADRQRDALQAFATARDRLGEEFGLEPGPALVALEQQILLQTLPAASPSPSAAPQDTTTDAPIALEVRGPDQDLATLVDLTLDPGAWMDRHALDDGFRLVLPNLTTAVRVATRLLRRSDSLTVHGRLHAASSSAQVQDLPQGHRAVFASDVGSLSARGWDRDEHGWTPPASTTAPRIPSHLEEILDRTTAYVDRGHDGLLNDVVEGTQRHAKRTVRIAGPSGIGKSSLLAVLAQRAVAAGAAPIYARARPAESLAGDPIVEAAYQAVLLLDRVELEHHCDLFGETLASILPEIATRVGRPMASPEQPLPLEVETALIDLIQRLARGYRVVLIIDDAPWLQGDATRLLQRLMSDQRTPAITLVLASRTNDPATPSLASELGALASGEDVHELVPFTIDQVARFLELAASSDRSPRTFRVAELVHQATKGLPLFVRELAHEMVQSTEWLTADGKWRIDQVNRKVALPTTLQGLLSTRLAQLDDEARQLVAVGAVFDEFNTLQVAAVSELPIADVLQAIDHLIEQRVIEPIPGLADHYRFEHPLLREATLSDVGPGRQSAIALAGAELLGLQPNASARLINRRADLWFRSLPLAAPERVTDELRAAADLATESGDHQLATLHLQRIIHVSESSGDTPALTARVALAEASVAAQTEPTIRRRQARAAFEQARDEQNAAMSARAALAFAGPFNPFGSLVEIDHEAEAMASQALDLDVADLALRAELLGMLAAARSDVTGAAPELEPALTAAVASGDTAVLGRMRSLEHALRSSAKPVSERLKADAEILNIAFELGDRHLELQGWGWSAAHAIEAGNIELLDHSAAMRTTLAERLGDSIYQWCDLAYQGMRQILAGRFEQADTTIWRALELGRLPLADHANRFFGLQLLKLSEMRGQGEALLPTTETFANQLGYTAAHISLAHLLVEVGDTARAAAIVSEQVPANLQELPATYDLLPSLAQLARIAQLTRDVKLASKVAARLRPFAGQICVHADAVLYGTVHHCLARCALAQANGEKAFAHLDRSIEHYEKLDAQAWLLLLEADRCDALRLQGNEASADERSARLSEQANDMGLAIATLA